MEIQFEKLLTKTLALHRNVKDFKEIIMEQTESHNSVLKMKLLKMQRPRKTIDIQPEKMETRDVIHKSQNDGPISLR